mgnify:CR=1 FL=1|tara:strand:- start:5539 stop:7398 length:1860 start_codon:yes stop_codon:yes gene_type:complete
MLSKIRENLSTWVVGLLVVLVAIPLVFMGLGDYQTPSNTYVIKINDQNITNSKIEQEVYQYKQALSKNYGGSIPPIYTDEFIKKITVEYIIRTTLIDQMSRDFGLVFHNQSILDDLYNTNAFRDKGVFSNDLYKAQLFRLNVTPEIYESYVYQKGISEQLKQSITDTSILTKNEILDLTSNRFQERVINFKILSRSQVESNLTISEDNLFDYYNSNKDNFREPEYAFFRFIEISKDNIYKNITITENELKTEYDNRLKDGIYSGTKKYVISHVSVSKRDDSDNTHKKIHSELLNGKSFAQVSNEYNVSKESKTNKGFMGEIVIEDLPTPFKSAIYNLEIGQISEPFEYQNKYHIISIKSITDGKVTKFDSVKQDIRNEVLNDIVAKKYFSLIDEVNEIIYSGDNDISYLSDFLKVEVDDSQRVNKDSGTGIFKFNHIRNDLFRDEIIFNQKLSQPIFIDEDRFIVAQVDKYYDERQMSFDESKNIIHKLLKDIKTTEILLEQSEELRDNLNADIKKIDSSFESFNGTTDSNEVSEELKNIFFNSNPTLGFQFKTMKSGDIMIFNIQSINKIKVVEKDDNYKDFINFSKNTYSESDFDRVFSMFRDNSVIDINNEILYQD